MDFSTEDASDLPSVPLRCAGVRSNHRSSAVSEGGRVFFSESQYADSPFLVRVTFDTVAFIHRGSHVVERRFVFPARVLHAVLVNFASNVSILLSRSQTRRPNALKALQRRF
ncbi:Anaphase-promoting complex subunit 1 [Phytophthora boehmeriae]|uniref:Anaphase-promoting complex subunit 1 n=1 Tax=Phytophthora boehmeriae TaxID=109152 RepID=A0A8T1X9T7_9STRA|nr:Anaphase-promoting complex subunit 1 [Phytophthora boehmeriae]